MATRFIDAPIREGAIAQALDPLRAEDTLTISDELRSDNSQLFFIENVGAEAARSPTSGFTFFTMGT